MSEFIPVIGSQGRYELLGDFSRESADGTEYTCHGVRTFSDFLAANEDLKTLIYAKYNLTDDNYNEDMANNVLIASLQSAKGYWVYVPVQYIAKVPDSNGVPYRAVSIVVKLPSMPAATDMSFAEADIADYVKATFGVEPKVRTVEQSRPVSVSQDIHFQKTAERNLLKTNTSTLTAENSRLLAIIEEQKTKIQELENYITTHP